jgi:hypothetical protein
MPHRLAHVVIVATLATTGVWHAPAFADDWWGSAQCKTHTQRNADPKTGKGGYTNDETHNWEIVIPQVNTSSNPSRACIQLRRIVTAASCTPARKFLASLS